MRWVDRGFALRQEHGVEKQSLHCLGFGTLLDVLVAGGKQTTNEGGESGLTNSCPEHERT